MRSFEKVFTLLVVEIDCFVLFFKSVPYVPIFFHIWVEYVIHSRREVVNFNDKTVIIKAFVFDFARWNWLRCYFYAICYLAL